MESEDERRGRRVKEIAAVERRLKPLPHRIGPVNV